jgi:ABC-2 type transport system permease protein
MSSMVEHSAAPPQSMAQIRRVGFQTIVIREFHRIVRIWSQTILPSGVTATLYFLIFGAVIGSRLGPMEGISYMTYIAPGLIMQAVILNSYNNVVSSFFGAKFGKHIEELLVSPLPSWIIVSGYVAGGLLRGAMVGLLVSIVTLFFTHLPVRHPVIVVAAAAMTSVTFALGGFLNAMFAKNFDQISIIPNFVLTPLIYLGGVFYSIVQLPAWAQHLSLVDPILYMVNAFRFGFLGVSDVPVVAAFTIMIIAIVALFSTAVLLLDRSSGIRE